MTRTNVFTLLTVLIRTAALTIVVALAINSVTWVAVVLPSLRGNDAGDGGFLLASLAVMFLAAGTLWLFADKLARLALARPDGQVFDSEIDAVAWQSIAFSVVGLWTLVREGLGLFQWLVFRFAVRGDWLQFGDDQRRDFVLGVIGSGVGAAVGIALLIGARGMVAALHRFRYGSPPAP